MITFDQAKKVAKKCIPNTNIYFEYPDAYIFTTSKSEDEWDDEVVIDKRTGSIISHTQFVIRNKSHKEVQAKLIV